MTQTFTVTIDATDQRALQMAEQRLHDAARWIDGVEVHIAAPAAVSGSAVDGDPCHPPQWGGQSVPQDTAEAVLTCCEYGCNTCRGLL